MNKPVYQYFVKGLINNVEVKGIEIMQVWEKVLNAIRPEVSDVAYNTWFSDIKPMHMDQNTFVLSVSNELILTMVNRYIYLIQNAIKSVLGNMFDVEIVVDNREPKYNNNIILSDKTDNGQSSYTNTSATYINPKYTFESFVVGNSNRFAHAAAVAVAESPSMAYNPLFLYGDSGLGKTHLMHAIANHILNTSSNMNVVYLSSEKFTNDLINAISTNTTSAFRTKYRSADVLLIDDIQFLAGKVSAQEEFFHTFNDLHAANKQIVITSDRLPREINTLEDRLRTRFEWGLTGDIQPPDYETRIAILKKKALSDNVDVPYDVYCYMADRIKSNIRELEGALTRITSYSKITGKKLTLELAEEALKFFILESGEVRITSKSIKEIVAKYYNIPVEAIVGKKKTKNIAFARQIAMYLCRSLTDMSLPIIGGEFGGRDHTTVIHSVNKIEQNMQFDRNLSLSIDTMTKELKTILK